MALLLKTGQIRALSLTPVKRFSQCSYSMNCKINKFSHCVHPSTNTANNYTQRRHNSYMTTVSSIYASISNSTPVYHIQSTLIEIHDASGLPWWSSIVISTILLRTAVTLPLTIYANKMTDRLQKINTKDMPALVEELKRETNLAVCQFKLTKPQAEAVYNRSLKKQYQKLIERDNCHPMKTLITFWGQIPLWVCSSVAIRNLVSILPNPNSVHAQIIYTQLSVGGCLWITNLTESDCSYILPVMLSLTNLAIIEIQTLQRKRTSRIGNIATGFFRILSIGMIPIASFAPAGLTLYWTTSSVCALVQTLALKSPKINRILKNEIREEHPYQCLATAFKEKLKQKVSKLSFNKKV